MFDVNLIEDNDFMDKDVSQLEKDYYLFHVDDNDNMYFFHKGYVFIGQATENDAYGNWVQYEPYTEGTLSQYVEKLKEIQDGK